jgi:hypothetical protein
MTAATERETLRTSRLHFQLARRRIAMSVDRIRQEPVIRHGQAESAVRVGTVVRVPWPDLSKAKIAEHDEEDEDAGGTPNPGRRARLQAAQPPQLRSFRGRASKAAAT